MLGLGHDLAFGGNYTIPIFVSLWNLRGSLEAILLSSVSIFMPRLQNLFMTYEVSQL